jgi:hypothetical protein
MNTRLQVEHLVDAHDRTWVPDRATATDGCTEHVMTVTAYCAIRCARRAGLRG